MALTHESEGWEQPAVHDRIHDLPPDARDLLGLSVQHPAPFLGVVRVDGELDMFFYLVGPTTKAVGRSLAVTALLPMLRRYPTLTQLLPELRGRSGMD